MKKRIFSPRLFLDGIKQLRIIGILSTVALSFIGIITPFMRYLNTLDYSIKDYTPNTVNYLEMNMPIVLLFCAIAPLMTLYLFSFLNKRDSSDFYHSIPETRQCIFLSFFGAIVSWLVFIAVASGAVITAAYLLFPRLYTVNVASIFLTGFNTLAGALLIAASVAIAMMLTGTVFSNILVSLLLIFLPRTLIHLAIMAVSDALPLVNGLSFASVLNYEYNVPVGFIFGFLFGNYKKPLITLSSGIYTIILAALFTVLALVLFVKRNSETAGQSAPNRTLQAIYRFLIGSVLTAVAVYVFFDTHVSGDGIDTAMLGTLVILFIVSLLLALAFQVITAHSFRNLLKYALGTTVSLLIFAGIYMGGIYGMYYTTMSYSPTAEEIESVRILSGSGNYYRTEEYFRAKTEKMELTDANARKIVAEQLSYSLELLKASRQGYWQTELTSIPVAIKSNGVTHQRNILVSSEQLASIYDAARQTEAFRKIYMELPESVATVYTHERGDIRSKDALYQVLLQEIEEIGFDKWYALQTSSNEYIDYYHASSTLASPTITSITCRFYEGMQWYEINVPLDVTVLPKTAQEYLRQNAEIFGDSDDLVAALRKENAFDKDDSLQIQFFNFDGDTPLGSVYINDDFRELSEEITAWADTLTANEIPDVTRPFYRVLLDDVTAVYEDNDKAYWHEYASYQSYYQGDVLPEWLLNLYRQQTEELPQDSMK